MGKPILCLDFDGVIHSYTSGWRGADIIPDEPVPGAFDFIIRASSYFSIVIFSRRSHQKGGIGAMRRWFKEHGGPLLLVYFTHDKPAAMVTIDDRAFAFTGIFPDAKELLSFRPWNKE